MSGVSACHGFWPVADVAGRWSWIPWCLPETFVDRPALAVADVVGGRCGRNSLFTCEVSGVWPECGLLGDTWADGFPRIEFAAMVVFCWGRWLPTPQRVG
jgi:hypothetical protein